ncbi:MAG TPA: hypothetical protein VFD80_05385, partial [Flavobacteriaceae bacterium]|nr:hypothetical protein [Flavobacteriaceae bacterium]
MKIQVSLAYFVHITEPSPAVEILIWSTAFKGFVEFQIFHDSSACISIICNLFHFIKDNKNTF